MLQQQKTHSKTKNHQHFSRIFDYITSIKDPTRYAHLEAPYRERFHKDPQATCEMALSHFQKHFVQLQLPSNLLAVCKFSIKKYIYFATLLSEITTLYRPDPALFEAKIRHLTRPDPRIWPFFCLDFNSPYGIQIFMPIQAKSP